jgi:hypothetical protein
MHHIRKQNKTYNLDCDVTYLHRCRIGAKECHLTTDTFEDRQRENNKDENQQIKNGLCTVTYLHRCIVSANECNFRTCDDDNDEDDDDNGDDDDDEDDDENDDEDDDFRIIAHTAATSDNIH